MSLNARVVFLSEVSKIPLSRMKLALSGRYWTVGVKRQFDTIVLVSLTHWLNDLKRCFLLVNQVKMIEMLLYIVNRQVHKNI